MKEFLVTEDNTERLEGGRIGYGERDFSGRRGSYKTYEFRLTAAAAEYVSVGDTIRHWRGASDGCSVDCGGEIRKKDGRIIHLNGGMDVGIDTGHPPHLGLQMEKAWKPGWDDAEIKIRHLAKHIETGTVLMRLSMYVEPSSRQSLESALQEPNLELWDEQAFRLEFLTDPKTQRVSTWFTPESKYSDWVMGSARIQKLAIAHISTKTPRITRTPT